jgi:hypothetical protein
MVQTCPQVACTASYHLEDTDEGKTFRCDKCGSLLLFEGGTLTIISGSASSAGDEPQPSIALGKGGKAAMLSPTTSGQSIPALVGSWLLALMFAFGSFLVVLFFFLPLIDHASIVRQQAVIDAGDRQQIRLDDRLWNRNQRRPRDAFMDRDRDRFMIDRAKDKDFARDFDVRDKDAPQPPNEAAQKKRRDERAEWEKTARQLDDALEDTRTSTRGRMYIYTWGIMFGFIVLGLAAVGFLSFGPTTARRVFGGIVITAEMLLIFTAYFIHYTALRMVPF